MKMKTRTYTCPHCGGHRALEILYGMPCGELFELEKAGKIVLGGCCVEENNPDRSCPECHFDWNSETGAGEIVLPEPEDDID